jgi:hypothetical protein
MLSFPPKADGTKVPQDGYGVPSGDQAQFPCQQPELTLLCHMGTLLK